MDSPRGRAQSHGERRLRCAGRSLSAFAVFGAGVVLASAFILLRGRGAVLMMPTDGAALPVPVLVIAIPLAGVTAAFSVAALMNALASGRALPLGLCTLSARAAALVVGVFVHASADVLAPRPWREILLLAYGAGLIAATVRWLETSRGVRLAVAHDLYEGGPRLPSGT